MNLLDAEFRLEEYCRRPSWIRGPAVHLADGRPWHLPMIDTALPTLLDEVHDDIQGALEIALHKQVGLESAEINLDELMEYHEHLSAIGVRLLRMNYQMPGHTWACLMKFDGLQGMFRLTLELSFILAHASAEWQTMFKAAKY